MSHSLFSPTPIRSMEDKKEKKWKIDLNDPAVRSVCVAIDGEQRSVSVYFQ